MKILKRGKGTPVTATVQTAGCYQNRLSVFDRYCGVRPETRMFTALRESVPIIDAAIQKIVRLLGRFEIICSDKSVQKELRDFLDEIPTGPVSRGINSYVCATADRILTYGTSVGEMVLNGNKELCALYNADLDNVEIKVGKNPLKPEIYRINSMGEREQILHPERILITALNPKPNSPYGESILNGLPFLSEIMLKIYNSIGTNFDRVGNLRYAVTYKPGNSVFDNGMAEGRAEEIASAWADAIGDREHVRDFVAVGDVDIKVIGADNQVLDAEVPLRAILEQIIAKLGLPPFLLGLSWSSTERMSSQQADILTSELEYYRELLSTNILKICKTYLEGRGICTDCKIVWNNISLQDETELAKARLYNAQAAKLEHEVRGEN